MNRSPCTAFCQSGAEKCGLLVVAFDKMYPACTDFREKYGGDYAWKAPTTAEVGPGFSSGCELKDLCGIRDMAMP